MWDPDILEGVQCTEIGGEKILNGKELQIMRQCGRKIIRVDPIDWIL